MKTRTKLLAGLLGMVMALSMTGCTGGDDAGDSSQESSNSSVRDADSEGCCWGDSLSLPFPEGGRRRRNGGDAGRFGGMMVRGSGFTLR